MRAVASGRSGTTSVIVNSHCGFYSHWGIGLFSFPWSGNRIYTTCVFTPCATRATCQKYLLESNWTDVDILAILYYVYLDKNTRHKHTVYLANKKKVNFFVRHRVGMKDKYSVIEKSKTLRRTWLLDRMWSAARASPAGLEPKPTLPSTNEQECSLFCQIS